MEGGEGGTQGPQPGRKVPGADTSRRVGATLGATWTNDFAVSRTHLNDGQGSGRGHGLI